MSSESTEPKEKVKFTAVKGLKSLPKVSSPGHSHKYEVHNGTFAKENAEFQAACSKVDVKPTTRQASKFRNKRGKAYTEGR
jgi:hypothetical protein